MTKQAENIFTREKIKEAVFQACHKLIVQFGAKHEKISLKNVLIMHPQNENFGDFATNAGMILAKQLKTLSNNINPHQICLDLCRIFEAQKPDFIDKITCVNNFLNISIKNEWFIKEAQRVLKEEKCYGTLSSKNKKTMVEYSHPNTHKEFHIGHLRNITTGESLVRILEAVGYKVIRSNYQGDVGIHIAKCLWALCKDPVLTSKITGGKTSVKTGSLHDKVKLLGKAYVIGSKAYEESEETKKEVQDINYLIYAAAQKYQEKEHGIKPGRVDYLELVESKKYNLDEIYNLWAETRQWSLDYFQRIYSRVYSHFDRFYFESQCLKGIDTCYDALKKGILKRSQGAIVFDGSPYGLDTRVFINSLGLPTYEGKELGLAPVELSEFGKLYKLIHVVTPEQTSFFKITFKVEELLGMQKDQQHHLSYGWVKLKEGKMSSRVGNVILAEWLLDEAKKRLKKTFPNVPEKTAEEIAVGAVKYSFLKQGVAKDIYFDFEGSISLEGNSGPYLQYTYARAKSVLLKSGPYRPGQTRSDLNNEELTLLRSIYKYPEVLTEAGEQYAPNILANYLYDLAQEYNSFYTKHRIISEGKTDKLRVLLTVATSQLLKNGLYLLGIKAPEKM